jgi:hypothetical protein
VGGIFQGRLVHFELGGWWRGMVGGEGQVGGGALGAGGGTQSEQNSGL